VHLRELTLDAFRSYEHLQLSLGPGLTLVAGDNATGKSNLLESIYLLAATRSHRAKTEGELVAWRALDAASQADPAVMRVAGTALRHDGPVNVEIALLVRSGGDRTLLRARSGAPLTSKRLRLNGIARRATDVVGELGAVLFTTHDIEILTGSPALRRRFLNLMIAQSERSYAPTYSRYDKALTQRNALLKRISEGQASAEELEPWDDVFTKEGGALIAARARALRELGDCATRRHAEIAPEDAASAVHLDYAPALGEITLRDDVTGDHGSASATLREASASLRRREIAAGATLVGPHRDDVTALLDGRSVAAYGSRAQQRSVALALRLAESDLLRERTGESPILLLDDLFSELDPDRREATASALGSAEQVILTTADAESVPPGLPPTAASYRIIGGELTPG
jgi:DNA replication and repair protein RecF